MAATNIQRAETPHNTFRLNGTDTAQKLETASSASILRGTTVAKVMVVQAETYGIRYTIGDEGSSVPLQNGNLGLLLEAGDMIAIEGPEAIKTFRWINKTNAQNAKLNCICYY